MARRGLPGRSRPGPRRRWARLGAAYGGGTVATAGAIGYGAWGVVRAEARLARRTIGVPTAQPPSATGSWGPGRPGTSPLRFAVLGDSSAAGLGAQTPEQTPAGWLSGRLARELDRRVIVQVVAKVGAKSADLDAQVARAAVRPLDLAMIMIGTNDVTHRVPLEEATRDLARAVGTLRAGGCQVVVGTCPDLGAVEPLLQPLKTVVARLSRRLARAQTVAVVEAGGTTVSLGDLLAPEFGAQPHLWSPDRFHPSAEGYARMSAQLLPVCLGALGASVEEPVRESVQHVRLAALVAARDPGLVVESVQGEQGAGSTGPGRLARLVRRLPLVGRDEPAGRTPDDTEATEIEERV